MIKYDDNKYSDFQLHYQNKRLFVCDSINHDGSVQSGLFLQISVICSYGFSLHQFVCFILKTAGILNAHTHTHTIWLRESSRNTSLSGEIIVCVVVPALYAAALFPSTSDCSNTAAGPGNKFLNKLLLDVGVFSHLVLCSQSDMSTFHQQKNINDGGLVPLQSLKSFCVDGENKQSTADSLEEVNKDFSSESLSVVLKRGSEADRGPETRLKGKLHCKNKIAFTLKVTTALVRI